MQGQCHLARHRQVPAEVDHVKLYGKSAGAGTDVSLTNIDLQGTDFRPDGAVVDAAGNLWNAQWGVGRVAVYDPQGFEVESFSFAGKQTSCPAFGGESLNTLYCTTAAVGLDGPEEGKTYFTKTSYRGQAEHQVIL